MLSKRSLGGTTTTGASPGKRLRDQGAVDRLCDLEDGFDLFSDEHNATNAKEKGWVRNRSATEKYQTLEKKLFALHKEQRGIEPLEADWVVELIPELGSLEQETLEAVLTQSARFAAFEMAARELVAHDRKRMVEEHQHELHQLRMKHESELTRVRVSSEMHLSSADEQAKEAIEDAEIKWDERSREYEERVEELSAEVEAKDFEIQQLRENANKRYLNLEMRHEELKEQLEQAQIEVELKRETTRKLKEEIIDNDRLTVANLNRIKNLESQVDEQRETIEQLDSQTGEEMRRGDEEKEELEKMLEKREQQVLDLAERLEAAEAAEEKRREREVQRHEGSLRRESLLDKMGLSGGVPRSPFGVNNPYSSSTA